MLATEYRSSNLLNGFYHFLTEKDEIQDFYNKLEKLNMTNLSKNYGKYNNYIVAPIYDGELAIIQLTEIAGLPIGLLYLLDRNEIVLVNFRFHMDLYKSNTHIYGELRNICGISYFEIFTVKLKSEEKLVQNLETFDQLLYTQFAEDFDIEPIHLVFKKFSNNILELDSKKAVYLNTNINGQHYITLGTA